MTLSRIGIIGGSGLGEALAERLEPVGTQLHHPDTPFGRPSGPIVTGEIGGAPIALLQRHGAGHVLNPRAVPYRANVYALRELGCTHVIASGATGSLREHIAPGEVVICDQLIDRTNGRPTTFFEGAAVHVEFADPFCPVMRRWLLSAADRAGVPVHDGGTYVCMEGPSFSTRAESAMHRQWGADLVGMTALPEARLAREAELAYALVGLPTDYDSWRPRPEGADAASLLEEIIGNLAHATEASIRLITAALEDVSILIEELSPAHGALALGIWTRPDAIPPEERTRLAALWSHRLG